MTKEVLISISGLHMEESYEDEAVDRENDLSEEELEQEEIKVLIPGSYYLKNGKHYLIFEERVEGFQQVTKSQIKWQDNLYLEVTKKGLTNMNMIYERNKKTQCFYNTPFGRLELGIFTNEIMIEETEENIDISVEYTMEANHQILTESKICINVKPRESETFSILD